MEPRQEEARREAKMCRFLLQKLEEQIAPTATVLPPDPACSGLSHVPEQGWAHWAVSLSSC